MSIQVQGFQNDTERCVITCPVEYEEAVNNGLRANSQFRILGRQEDGGRCKIAVGMSPFLTAMLLSTHLGFNYVDDPSTASYWILRQGQRVSRIRFHDGTIGSGEIIKEYDDGVSFDIRIAPSAPPQPEWVGVHTCRFQGGWLVSDGTAP